MFSLMKAALPKRWTFICNYQRLTNHLLTFITMLLSDVELQNYCGQCFSYSPCGHFYISWYADLIAPAGFRSRGRNLSRHPKFPCLEKYCFFSSY